jgi:predicted transcriptional regulator
MPTGESTALKCAELAAQGYNQREIAKEVGIIQQGVSYHLAKPEIKAIIEETHKSLVQEIVERSAANITHAVMHYQDEPREVILHDNKGNERDVKLVIDEQLREHGFKASIKMLESTGILASPAPSIFVQQIFNQQTNVFGSNTSILDKLTGRFTDPQEVEVIDYEDNSE